MKLFASAIVAVVWCSLIRVHCMPSMPNRPTYVECVSSDECSFDSCCVLGMSRYSIPMCQKKLQPNEACRPASDESVNSTVTYLDGQVVSLYHVHELMCPCADGLTCDRQTGKCTEFDAVPTFNDLSFDQHQMPQD